jgi:hypothetical protein
MQPHTPTTVLEFQLNAVSVGFFGSVDDAPLELHDPSREAVKECSPPRKRRVRWGARASPSGAKEGNRNAYWYLNQRPTFLRPA